MSPECRPSLLAWQRAVLAADLADGVQLTAIAWSHGQWWWDSAMTEAEALSRRKPLGLVEFGARYREGRAQSTLRHDFAELLAAGLLQVHHRRSRWSPTVYVPRLPVPAAHTEEEPEREQGRFLSAENRALKIPNSAGNPAVLEPLSAQQPALERWESSGAPLLEEVQGEPPSRGRGPGPARETAAPQRPGRGGGDVAVRQENPEADRALAEVLGAMRSEDSRRVADGYRREAARVVQDLLAAGWRPHHIASEVASGTFAGAGIVGAVLVTRLKACRTLPVPGAEPRFGTPDPGGTAGGGSLAEVQRRREADAAERAAAVPAPAGGLRAAVQRERDSAAAREPQEVGS